MGTPQRDRIRMSEAELAAFLAAHHRMTVATIGPRGRPHLMPVHYFVDAEGAPVTWTYARSQKTLNLERDPRATLQVETGEAYAELRGAMLEAEAEIIRDPSEVSQIGLRVVARYGAGITPESVSDEARAKVVAQAPKRVGVRFLVTRAVTWDHRKLS